MKINKISTNSINRKFQLMKAYHKKTQASFNNQLEDNVVQSMSKKNFEGLIKSLSEYGCCGDPKISMGLNYSKGQPISGSLAYSAGEDRIKHKVVPLAKFTDMLGTIKDKYINAHPEKEAACNDIYQGYITLLDIKSPKK